MHEIINQILIRWMRYEGRGFKIRMIIGCTALVIYIIMVIVSIINNKRKKKNKEEE